MAVLSTVLSKQTPVTIASQRSLDLYQDQWNNMRIVHLDPVISAAKQINQYRSSFEAIVTGTKIPWQFAGIIYYREDGLIFKGHPHNGDSLKRRTFNVPAGRPVPAPANPATYTIVESFRDLIHLKRWDDVPTWSMSALLYYFESNNGFGYRRLKSPINSPYLWSMTDYYKSGKYVSDGHYDAGAIDKQVGCAPLLRCLTDKTMGIVK